MLLAKDGMKIEKTFSDGRFALICLLALERQTDPEARWLCRTKTVDLENIERLSNFLSGKYSKYSWVEKEGEKSSVVSKINKVIPGLIVSEEINDLTYYTLNPQITDIIPPQ